MSELIAIGAVAVVAWFAAGTIRNVHRGRALMRWMQGGLPLLGSRTTMRWLGSSVVEMAIRETRAPFTAVTVIIVLEPRDLPWGFTLRRRDTLIIRGTLRQPPEVELEALDPTSWSGREAMPRVPSAWTVRPAATAGSLAVYHPDARALAHADALLKAARDTELDVLRLSLRRAEPNIQLHVPYPDTGRPARAFFEAVRSIAGRALA